MKKLLKYAGLLILPLGFFISCGQEDNYPDTSQYKTEITGITIVNGGLNGDTEITAEEVNENTKRITFPKVHQDSDLSAVRFRVTTTDERAKLAEESYDFTMEPGVSSKTVAIKLVNNTRYREYFVTIKLDIPVWGADFENVTAYAFTGANIYPDLSGANTRQADMDSEHVLMISRHPGSGPHLLKISDLKAGTIAPIMLNMTNVAGGTFAVSGGRLAQGRVYICNLATPPAGAVKIYYWATPTSEPQLLYSLTDQVSFAAGRFGDFMSMDLDAAGNGYIFMGVNPSQTAYKAVRLKVSGFTNISEPTLINFAHYAGLWASVNKVDGVANEYLYSGHQGATMLANVDGGTIYTIPVGTLPAAKGSDAFIINFNKERYLVTNEVPGTGTISVYDITLGDDTKAALERMSGTPILMHSLSGNVATGTAVGSIAWSKDGDDTLYLFGAAPGAGFSILEIPKKVQED